MDPPRSGSNGSHGRQRSPPAAASQVRIAPEALGSACEIVQRLHGPRYRAGAAHPVPLLATAFWVGIDSGLAPSAECSLHAGFSEQHRPPIFGGVDQHLYSQTPFRRIAFRFGEPPNIIAGISQCSCRRLTGQRYGPAKWTIPRHKTSLHNGIPSGAGAQRNGPSGG